MNTENSITQQSVWWQQSAPRSRSASAERVLLIGLDGATFDILKPMIDQGRMPNFKSFLERGASGILMSTTPPITPAAWTTFMTGKGPGRHGIIDFERYDPKTNGLSFNSVYEIKERTIWQILGHEGLRVGSIQVPMTYPPKAVNGFLITGFETPGTDAEFTYPPELKHDILRHWPDFTFKTQWRRSLWRGLDTFKQNLQHVKKSFDQGVFLAKHCGEKYGWEVMMVLYKLVDNLQHKTWKYLDPKTAGRDPLRAQLSADCFNHLDNSLGDLFSYAASRDATVMIISDHGHGSLDGKVQPNLLLQQWGYLGIDSTAQARTRTNVILQRWFRKKKGKFAANYGIEHDLAIDWQSTKAFVAHAGMCGFLYINLKGRQPTGVVEARDYESLRDEISAKMQGVSVCRPDGTSLPAFAAVHKPEALYGCSRNDQPWLPDLMLVPAPGLAVVRKIRGQQPVAWSSFRKLEGTHRQEGILVAGGPGIQHATDVSATLSDIAPTLLAALGVKVPRDMEGRVLSEIFSTAPDVEYDCSDPAAQTQHEEEVFSEEEQAILTERLADLGYLE